MVRSILVLLALFFTLAAIVERLVITVGQKVITEQQLDEEIRVTAFINHEKVTHSLQSRRAAADHLVQQLLVRREMELSHYPEPDDQDVENYASEVRAGFGTPTVFAQTLAEYDLTEAILKEHLALQLTTLRFIGLRFRPDAGISDSEIEAAYRRELTAWEATHPGATPPSLTFSRESIRKALLESHTDEVLNAWLEETRKQVNIVYLDKALQ